MGKPIKKQIPKPAPQPVQAVQQAEPKKKFSFNLGIASMPRLSNYLPGIILFVVAVVLALVTYRDYGISYDEPLQRAGGLLSYNYVFHGNRDLLHDDYANRGFYNFIPVGFELPLVIIEKMLNLTDSRDIYLMRHLVTHILFLISALSLYVLAYRLFRNKFIASLGFIMLVLAPRLYAHSFFNTRDLPFLSIFVIAVTFSQIAFEKNKPLLFFLVGGLCGYATSIRILGIMIGCFIFFFLLIDLVGDLINKRKPMKPLINIISFSVGFCFLLVLAWPYLWRSPVHNLLSSLSSFSRFPWNGTVLLNGKYESGSNLPWTYFPTWFLITNPELWLISGFAGIVWVIINFFKKPSVYLGNTRERNFLLYLLCFFAPIFAVIFLHSVIYNDWRHLYFVYPSFVLLALYFFNGLLKTRYGLIVQGVCVLQIGLTGFFMIKNHPLSNLYFNNLVSHDRGFLRKNYEMDYWDCSFKQGIDLLLAADQSKNLKINSKLRSLVERQILLLPKEDRDRIQYTDMEDADYFIPFSRDDVYDKNMPAMIDSVTVLNSIVICIFKAEKNPGKLKQMRENEIAELQKSVADNPKDPYTVSNLAFLLTTQKKYPQAIALYKKVIELDSNFENAQFNLGDAYFYNAQYDSAEIYERQALRQNPKSSGAVNDLAGIYFFRKQYPQAIEFYKNAVRLNPGYVKPYANIGVCYLYLNKYDSAIFYSNKAVAIDPAFNSSYEILAATYNAAAKTDSAKKYEAIAQKRGPRI